MINLWPLAAYAGFVLFLVAGVIVLSFVLAARLHGRATGEPYESGIVPTGSARVRLSSKFYVVAILFVLHSPGRHKGFEHSFEIRAQALVALLQTLSPLSGGSTFL